MSFDWVDAVLTGGLILAWIGLFYGAFWLVVAIEQSKHKALLWKASFAIVFIAVCVWAGFYVR